ncbi:MAG: TonB-dependent receptor [Lewinellaceae bacterium]|nr:TonB-dependent receptor [Lewinellaceae bacterium]
MNKLILLLVLALVPVWVLSAQGVLTGQVVDEKGEPLPGAHVLIKETGKGVLTDESGRFRVEGLERGLYTLLASYLGYQDAIQTVEVKPGESPFTSFQLEREVYTLENLVVSAIRAGAHTPITYKNLGKEELETNNLGQDVPYILRFTPSLVETSDAGNGVGYTGLRIRGSDPTRINITINGIPLNDAESQGVYWVNLPDLTSSTEDIQIQRGVGTSTNGAGAFGASINLNTNKYRQEPFAQLAGSAGSFNTWRRSAQFGSGLLNQHFTVEGRLSAISSDGYIDRASADLSSYYFSGAYLGDRTSLRFNLFSGHEVTYQAWYGVPEAYLDDPELRTYNPAGTEKAGDPYDNEVDDYQQTHYQLLFNRQLSARWSLNLNGHYTRGYGFYEQYKAEQDLAGYGIQAEGVETSDLIRRLWLDNHFYGITYALNYQGNRMQWTLGGAANRYLGNHYGEVIWARFAGDSEIRHRYYENKAEKRDINVFSKWEYSLSKAWSAYLDLQYRTIFYEFLGYDRQGNNVTQSVDLHFFNPKAGLFWQVDEHTAAYASFAVGHREPNRNDYTDSSPDSRPRAERMFNTEVGFQHIRRQWGLHANLYHMYYQDQLVLTGQLNDVGEYTRINVPVSYRLGLELEARWQSSGGWKATGGLTISRNKISGFQEYLDQYDEGFNWLGQALLEPGDVDLAFSPGLIGTAQIGYDFLFRKGANKGRSLELALLNKYVGKQYLDNSGAADSALDPYFYSDLRLTLALPLKWVERMELAFQVSNLWNRYYASNGWSYRYRVGDEVFTDKGFYPQAGRNFLVSFKLNL